MAQARALAGVNNCDPNAPGCEPDSIPWYRRPAGGVYMGGSGAVRWGPVSLYSRLRMQAAFAKNVPPTQWLSGFGGLHFHIRTRVDLWLGSGVQYYGNRLDQQYFVVTELGIAVAFDPHVRWRR